LPIPRTGSHLSAPVVQKLSCAPQDEMFEPIHTEEGVISHRI